MYKTSKLVNGKKLFDRKNLEGVMQYYTKKYCQSSHELCEIGYSSSPYSFNDIDFRTAVVEEFPNELRWLKKSMSSGVSFNEVNTKYAIKATRDEDFRHVMSTYLNVVTSKKMLEDCNSFMDVLNFNKTGKASSSIRVVVSEGVQLRSRDIVHPEMLVNSGYNRIRKVNLCECVIHELCKDIGISEEEYLRHKETGNAFFLKNVTREEEEKLSEGIVLGNLPLYGKYGELLLNRMVAYYKDYNERHEDLSTVPIGYDRYIYAKCTPERNKLLESMREKLYADGCKEIFLDNTYAYYQYYEKAEPVVHQTIYVGHYCNIPDLVETFEGIQGVFSVLPEGIPTSIKGYGVVYLCEDANYVELTEDDVFEEFGCSSVDELMVILHKFTKSDITTELLYAMLRARCGYMKYTFKKDMSSVTEAEYQNCCKEALYILRYTFNLL